MHPRPTSLCASPAARLPDISIPMAPDALSSDQGRLGGGVGWGQGTINLPACVSRWGVVAQDSCAVFLEVELGLRQRQKRGKSLSTRGSFLALPGILSGFQRTGEQAMTSDRGGPTVVGAEA